MNESEALLRELASLTPAAFNRSMSTCRILFAFFSLGLFALIACADEASDKTELIQFENDFAAILVKNDLPALENKLSADWKLVLSEGAIMTREQLVAHIKSGKLRFSSHSVDELDVRIYGDAAVVIGIALSKGTWDGEEFNGRDRFTDVFIRKDGKWRCVSSHNSNLNNG